MLKIIEYSRNEQLLNELYSFCETNDCLFVDPFMNHVDIRQYINKLIDLGKVFIALNDSTVVGVAAAYMNDNVRFISHLQYLLVSNQYQKIGIGGHLLEKVFSASYHNGMKKVLLTVDKDNDNAIKFYINHGFTDWPIIHDNNKKKYMVKYIDYGYETYDMSKIHMRLFDMGSCIARILEKNEIPYMLAFGSLLGAVRHKGFIPWDDDFDLFLFSDTYERALQCLREELPESYIVEYNDNEPDYFHSWAHVKDRKSIAICDEFRQDGIYVHNGISIDLYMLHEMNNSDLDLFLLKENIAYISRLHNLKLIDDDAFEKKKQNLVLDIENEKRKKYEDSIKNKCFAMTLREKKIDYEYVFPLKKYEFEKRLFWGPNDYNAVLHDFYGDYMKLPAEEHRVPHYSIVKGEV